MASSTVNPRATRTCDPAHSKSVTDDQLGETIITIDALSQGGFDAIVAMANAGRLAFETPGAYDHPQLLANLFRAIQSAAQDARNAINSEAESVGCDHKGNAAWQRQWDAMKTSEARRANAARVDA